MKTITLQIEDSIYEKVVKFLQLIPNDIKIVEKSTETTSKKLKEQKSEEEANINQVLEFSGIINNNEAFEMKEIINREFNKNDSEW